MSNIKSYDITMCRAAGCSRKETCHRWLQHQRYLKDKDPNKPMLVSMLLTYGKIGKDCEMYWEEKGKQP